jgi:hypothetical protein
MIEPPYSDGLADFRVSESNNQVLCQDRDMGRRLEKHFSCCVYSRFDGNTRVTAGEVALRSEMEEKWKALFLQMTKVGDRVRFVMKGTA